MILYFENSRGQRREIGQPDTLTEARQIIADFLADHNFKSYYTRMWDDEEGTWFDVGSHSEFFLCRPAWKETIK